MIPLTRNPIFHNGGLSCDCTKGNFIYMFAIHFYVSDDYLGRKNIKNMFISNLKSPWLNYMTSSLRQTEFAYL